MPVSFFGAVMRPASSSAGPISTFVPKPPTPNISAAAKLTTAAPAPSSCPRARAFLLSSFSPCKTLGSYIAEADAKGGCLAIPSRLRVTGACSMALTLCPPVPVNCARIVINAAKGFSFTLHIAAAGGGEVEICSDGTSSSSDNSCSHSPLSIDSSRSCGEMLTPPPLHISAV